MAKRPKTVMRMAEKDLLAEYQRFDDLKVVLPLYYGRIQFVTTKESDIKEIADLAGKAVYFGGDNIREWCSRVARC